jgi:hypothetical protein
MSVMANIERREVVIRSRSRVEDAVRTMSPMYNKRKAVPSVHRRTNSDVSEHDHVKPIEVMKVRSTGTMREDPTRDCIESGSADRRAWG